MRVIVPLSAGGSADIVGRVLAQKIGEKLGQQVVIDNRPGAGSIIGTELAARAPADGYTLLLAGSSFTSAPSVVRKLPYDPLKDFAPITMPANAPGLLVVHPTLPARTVNDLVALARAKPGQINYASPGNGTAPHFAGALFNILAKIDTTHIPYKGAGPAVTAVMSGESQVSFASMPSAIGQVRQGRLRGVAVTSLTALRGDPGASDGRRIRIARVRVGILAGFVRARRHARTGYTDAASHDGRGRSTAGGHRATRERRFGARRQHARNVREACCGRACEVGAGGEGSAHARGVNVTSMRRMTRVSRPSRSTNALAGILRCRLRVLPATARKLRH